MEKRIMPDLLDNLAETNFVTIGHRKLDDGTTWRCVVACGKRCEGGCAGRDMAGCTWGNIEI